MRELPQHTEEDLQTLKKRRTSLKEDQQAWKKRGDPNLRDQHETNKVAFDEAVADNRVHTEESIGTMGLTLKRLKEQSTVWKDRLEGQGLKEDRDAVAEHARQAADGPYIPPLAPASQDHMHLGGVAARLMSLAQCASKWQNRLEDQGHTEYRQELEVLNKRTD